MPALKTMLPSASDEEESESDGAAAGAVDGAEEAGAADGPEEFETGADGFEETEAATGAKEVCAVESLRV